MMKSWFIAENDGTILEIRAKKDPWWFGLNCGGLVDNREGAIMRKREVLREDIHRIERDLREAKDRLRAFEAGVWSQSQGEE